MERLVGELRPKLHRYCARMTGSVIDGEDVLEEATVKAIEALPMRDRSRIRKVGSFESPTMLRLTFFVVAPGGMLFIPWRTRT